MRLWLELLKRLGIPVTTEQPTRQKGDAETFNRITGWEGRTNGHARDAGQLVFGQLEERRGLPAMIRVDNVVKAELRALARSYTEITSVVREALDQGLIPAVGIVAREQGSLDRFRASLTKLSWQALTLLGFVEIRAKEIDFL